MKGKSFIAELRAKPGRGPELIALQAELKRLVFEREPDALVYELFQSDEDPDLFQIVATFRDDAAFDHHMQIDFHDRLVPPILACVDGEMKLAFYRSLG
ncbi:MULTISPECIES: putative quinol monooxygenase [unclassified Sphingomonas]|uniref:putative quinol monooxygenase n=1 Tax=unclassified Sphingomonas TaxID=196159 RepID=UPI000701DDA8|nr:MULTISPECIES: antibiotic biosynthesis monooxygenase family protein [unclassified Sphingomonas]KQX23336.1 antibiotic biosynthesis monooxygenase [Sphingomonas sp. Root1294]KQY68185.1 antibiotic biosynthesis monooxygenase [Sphingomonas sp. Root50]KRB91080.1 antibiotic biosynthesis monooxygenase [Sphingomonas sp. Root720]